MAVNPSDDLIYVVDAASSRIVQQGKLDKGADQIAFTNKQAHIRHRDSDAVLMIALTSLGSPGAQISIADFGFRLIRASAPVRPPTNWFHALTCRLRPDPATARVKPPKLKIEPRVVPATTVGEQGVWPSG